MSDKRIHIHQLPEFAQLGYEPTVEYTLPCVEDGTASIPYVDAWLRSVSKLDSSRAYRAWQQRIRCFRISPSLHPLWTALRIYRPKSIAIWEEKAWLLVTRKATATIAADFLLIREPVEADAVKECCGEAGHKLSEGAVRFLQLLSGAREDFAPSGGAFVDARMPLNVLSGSWMQANVTNYNAYENAIALFTARNGDQLLLRSDESFGWLRGEELQIVDFAESIAEFCMRYGRHLSDAVSRTPPSDQRVQMPFDAYCRCNGCARLRATGRIE